MGILQWLETHFSDEGNRQKAEAYFEAECQRKWGCTYEERQAQQQQKLLAQRAVKKATESGELARVWSLPCAECGNQAEHYHHSSYAEEDWLNVTPLCRSCHGAKHRKATP